MDHEGLVKAAAVCREKCCERLIGEVDNHGEGPY